jgi:hypothetical protein
LVKYMDSFPDADLPKLIHHTILALKGPANDKELTTSSVAIAVVGENTPLRSELGAAAGGGDDDDDDDDKKMDEEKQAEIDAAAAASAGVPPAGASTEGGADDEDPPVRME